MSHLKGLTGFAAVAAACTAMTWSGIARAATPDAATATPATSTLAASSLSLEQPVPSQQAASAQYADDSTFTPWTLQGAIDKTPVGQFLDKYKLTLNMFAEGSYVFNFRRTPDLTNYTRVFDTDREHFDLNQLDFQVARAVTPGNTAWDVGGLIEVLYGSDGRYIHSNGLNFYGSANPQLSPLDQWDLEQAYITVNAPYTANGLQFEIGKFATLLGYETINPTSNALFSHTYSFGYAIPFTNTGALVTYTINNQWSFTGGFTRGWDQALKDNNGDALDVIGEFAYTSYNVKGLSGDFNFISGPESADIVPGHVNRYWRSVGEAIVKYAWGDNWNFAGDALFGYEPKAGVGGKDANWYGASLYATYKIDPHVSVTGRGEYFNDDDGARGLGTDVYEATVGLEITPFPTNTYLANLLIRPEVREDWARTAIFDAGTKYSQGTVGGDIIYKF